MIRKRGGRRTDSGTGTHLAESGGSHAVAVEVTDMKERGGDAREYVAAAIYVERVPRKVSS